MMAVGTRTHLNTTVALAPCLGGSHSSGENTASPTSSGQTIPHGASSLTSSLWNPPAWCRPHVQGKDRETAPPLLSCCQNRGWKTRERARRRRYWQQALLGSLWERGQRSLTEDRTFILIKEGPFLCLGLRDWRSQNDCACLPERNRRLDIWGCA
jgi:hypothetical protein